MCDRCRDPNKVDLSEYTLIKADGSKRKTTLCDDCAEATRSAHVLTGGKTAEAEPSPSESAEEDATEPETPDEAGSDEPVEEAPEGGGETTNPARKRTRR